MGEGTEDMQNLILRNVTLIWLFIPTMRQLLINQFNLFASWMLYTGRVSASCIGKYIHLVESFGAFTFLFFYIIILHALSISGNSTMSVMEQFAIC